VSHLSTEEREVIARMLFQGTSQKAIAKEISRSASTVSRELGRNRKANQNYSNRIADGRASARRSSRPLERKMENPELLASVGKKLEENWSPEQISGRLAEEEGKSVVSHQTIYGYLNGLERWHPHRQAMRRRGRRYRSRKDQPTRSRIPNRVPISKRPKVVALRKRFGDWELDLVVGTEHSGFLVTAVDRRSGFALIRKVSDKRSATVMSAIIAMFKEVSADLLKTFTFDNGTEFTNHAILTERAW
jgi:IS30 family transposase